MASLIVFYRLMVRPLKQEPARNLLTIVAVGLGVAVVVAIHLAREAATGSFRSSLETLAGDADLEISAIGGLDEVSWPTSSRFPTLFNLRRASKTALSFMPADRRSLS